MDRQEKVEHITQETIGQYVANNKDFWDTFHKGSKDAEYSFFTGVDNLTKDEFTDFLSDEEEIIIALKNLFKNILLKNEFFVAGIESGLVLTNYRLMIFGANIINIPLNKITKYGIEGNHYVIKYLRKGKERSISLEQIIIETLVNSVIDAEEFESLNEEQIYIIENSRKLKKDFSTPNYSIPPKSQKTKKKEEKISKNTAKSFSMYKIIGTIILLLLVFFGVFRNWYDVSEMGGWDWLWPHAIVSVIILILTLIWIVLLFKKKSIIGNKYFGWLVISFILTIIWLITYWVGGSQLDSYYLKPSIKPAYYISLILTLIFGIFTGIHVGNRDE